MRRSGGVQGVAGVLVLAARRFGRQNMPHHAAAITYYSLFALGQAALLAVGLLGVLGSDESVAELARMLRRAGVDPNVADGVVGAARHAVDARGASALAVVFAVVVAVLVASSAFVAASTALNVVVEASDPRGGLRRRLDAVLATLVVLALGIGALIAVLLGGALAEEVLASIGLGDTAAAAWRLLRFPIAGVLAMTAFAWTYYAGPTVAEPRWRWISLGAGVAVVVWLASSVGLFVFTAHFHSYNTTYGAFATAMVLIVWLWLTNLAMLYGAEVNAAGRFADDANPPVSRTGDSPEDAQHLAARRHVG